VFSSINGEENRYSNLIVKSATISQRDFQPRIEISNANFSYPNSQHPALSDISLKIGVGSRVAITGRTGSGKSTLADLILGLINPSHGLVHVSGVDAELAIKNWPGKISYVGTILENIALGLSENEIDRVEMESLLEKLQLLKFLKETREGLDTWVGERGVALSGGQKQRLGLARALYLKPKLLILDEATSALDSETEEVVSETISMLSDEVTVVSIAHRLATIRYSDFIVHLEKGEIIGIGNFSEMKKIVPEFRNQAKLLGL
jgi:ABC-type multidrug transport system fused ATPase/permease subunit